MSRILKTKMAAAVAAGLALAAVAGGLYGTASLRGNRAEAACEASAATLDRLRPLARGAVAAFEVGPVPARAADLAFDAPDGRRVTLAEFRGRTILLNLWATWCEPCKREMPALDRLQAELGGSAFEVVAVNIDTRDLDRPRLWLAAAGIRALAPYADKEARTFQVLRSAGETQGLPATLVIDARGCRLGRLAGWADWAEPESLALVRAAIGP